MYVPKPYLLDNVKLPTQQETHRIASYRSHKLLRKHVYVSCIVYATHELALLHVDIQFGQAAKGMAGVSLARIGAHWHGAS